MKKIYLAAIAVLSVLPFVSKAQWAGTTDIYNTNSGNVGIGTNTPSFSLDIHKITATLNLNGSGFGNSGAVINLLGWAGTSRNWQIGVANIGPAGLNFTQSTSAGGSTFTTPVMTILDGGNVGIGTTSPNAKLDIANTLSGSHNANTSLLHITDGYNAGANGQFFQIIGAGDGTNYTNMNLISNYGYLSFGARADGNATPTNSLNILSSGNVGIGTTSPNGKLEVNSSYGYFDTMPTFATAINAQSGSSNTLTITNSGGVSRVAGINFHSTTDGDARLFNSGNVKSGFLGSTYSTAYLTLGSANGGTSYNDEITLTNGKVGIGTTTPDEQLSVLGKIHANEVKVDMSVPGPDYVFKPDYKLPSLAEVKTYVDKNHHLSEIPSADEMAKNGLNLGDMNTKLLKKVEELTLYLIAKDQQVEEQKAINKSQLQTNLSLQAQLTLLKQQLTALLEKSNTKH